MKKYLAHIMLGLALVDLIVLMYLIGNKAQLGISLIHPFTIICGVSFIIFFTVAVAQFMKRMD